MAAAAGSIAVVEGLAMTWNIALFAVSQCFQLSSLQVANLQRATEFILGWKDMQVQTCYNYQAQSHHVKVNTVASIATFFVGLYLIMLTLADEIE